MPISPTPADLAIDRARELHRRGVSFWAILRVTPVPEYSTVADWFAGSGTTGIACMRSPKKLKCILCEKDPVIFSKMIARLEREVNRET